MSVIVKCGICGKEAESNEKLADGQHVRCPFCGGKSEYRKPARIELPTGLASARRSDGRVQKAVTDASESSSLQGLPVQQAKEPLHVIRPQQSEMPRENPEGGRRLRMAEERVRFYEEMRSMAHRRKMWGNITSTLILAVLVCGGVVTYVLVQDRREKTRQAELAYAVENARLEAERAEQSRQERLKQEEEQKAARERRLAEESERLAREKAERQKAEKEIYEARMLYREAIALFRDGAFCFADQKPKEQGPEEADGVRFYLLPFLENGEIVVCTSTTNGMASTYRLNEAGLRVPIENADFLSSFAGKDYLMAEDGKVYFHSKRRKPHVGQISKTEVVDLPKEFFGDVAQAAKKIDIDPEGLSFEVVFIPNNSKKVIISETVEYGASYSLEKVREAVEEAFPMKRVSSISSPAKQKRYKRTTVLWDGAHVKRGIDGVTYVPRAAPPADVDYGHVIVRGPGWDYSRASRSYYKARRRDAYTREQWQALHDEALRQDQAEREYYEKQTEGQRGDLQKKLSETERAHSRKIDKIINEGTLYFRARIRSEGK